jgi:UDP-N-acetylmuramoyl-L-alanyl-D-glutamate--2,6-diaminopimelate ligase
LPILPAIPSVPPRPAVPPGPYLVAGLGRAGLAAACALLHLEGAQRVRAWDHSRSPTVLAAREHLAGRGVEVVLGGDGGALGRDPRSACVVKSPGIAFDAPVVTGAAARGAAVIDELELGWRLSGEPMVAVTGTNGKTTVAALALATVRAAGAPARLAGNTSFGPPLSAAPGRRAWMVCEVSSYQLEGCPELLPEVAVFTNLTRDHLLRHRTMERYGELKRRLFLRAGQAVPLAVISVDQAFGRALARDIELAGGRVVRYGNDREADYRIVSCRWGLRSSSLSLSTPHGRLELETRLPGVHNALNFAAAAALAGALGLGPEVIETVASSTQPVPGRFEPIDEGQPFDVVVDCAHGPDALRHVLETARGVLRHRSGGRLLAVVSCAGIHDPPKRPQMGRIARSLADHLVLTTGSLYGASASALLGDLLEGAARVEGATVDAIPDRRAAIGRAIRAARRDDLVIIIGRGAEWRLRLDAFGEESSFDDRAVAREHLRDLSLASSLS